MEDEEIIRLYLMRDEAAIRETAGQYGGFLKRLARQFLDSEQDAEECVNDTYLKAWQSIPPNRPVHFRAYLAKICRHTAFGIADKLHAQKRSATLVELTTEMEQCIPSRMPETGNEQLAEILNTFLADLPAEKRSLFVRRYWYGDSIAELARETHSSESRVKTTLYRIRTKLRDYLERNGVSV